MELQLGDDVVDAPTVVFVPGDGERQVRREVKAKASCIEEAEPTYAAGFNQFWVADEFAPVLFLVGLSRDSALLRSAVIVEDYGLVETHPVAEYDPTERLLNQPK
ncbi:MAG TPA: hypothetical protein VH092_05625 [Urbifossiella sp.]|nr:hypothetical protein [Urbifossiella sp.]